MCAVICANLRTSMLVHKQNVLAHTSVRAKYVQVYNACARAVNPLFKSTQTFFCLFFSELSWRSVFLCPLLTSTSTHGSGLSDNQLKTSSGVRKETPKKGCNANICRTALIAYKRVGSIFTFPRHVTQISYRARTHPCRALCSFWVLTDTH